jgi:phosphoenolpyruvate-protein kinase (PTS system EI component)
MASREPKISTQADTGTTTDITLTIPETLEIIMNPGNATSHSVIMAAYKFEMLTIYGTKKHNKNYL